MSDYETQRIRKLELDIPVRDALIRAQAAEIDALRAEADK